MTDVGRDPWRSACAILFMKEGHIEQVVQDHIQMCFEYLLGWNLHNHTWLSVLVLSPSQSPYVQTEQPVFHLVPVASYPVTGHQ